VPSRRALAALAAAAIALPATVAVAAEDAPAPPEVRDVTIVNPGDGHRIAATVFRPAGADATDPVPMVLHSHGWAGSRETDPAGAVAPYLEAGYGVLSFDQRGFGESTDDKANVMDPAKEGRDVLAVVDHVAGLDWVARDGKDDSKDPNDPVLYAVGGSYGGGYQFAGAVLDEVQRRQASKGAVGTRFDALAPEITWHDLNEALGPQGVPRALWDTLLVVAGANALPQEVIVGYAVGIVTGTMPDGTDLPPEVVDRVEALVAPLGIDAATVAAALQGPDIVGFLADNGPARWADLGVRLDIPVLIRQGTTDNLFNLNHGLDNFARILTPGARSRSTFIGYNGGHALPQVLPLGTQGSGDPCTALAADDFPALAVEFFGAVASTPRPRPLLLDGLSRYNVATPDGQCLRADQLTPTPVELDLPLPVAVTTGVGVPVNIPIATGPLDVAGVPVLRARVESLGLDNRVFAALSVGRTPLDARVVQNNVLPVRTTGLSLGEQVVAELPGVGVRVAEGETLYLTLSPLSDMFLLTGSRVPGGMVFRDITVDVPRPAGAG